MIFVETIEKELKKRKMSASRLCKLAGITRSTFSAMKTRGAQPKPLTRRAIAKALSLNPDTLEPIGRTAWEDYPIPKGSFEIDPKYICSPMDVFINWAKLYEAELKAIPSKMEKS